VFDARADATAADLIRLSLQAVGLDPEETGSSAASASVGRAYATVGCARSVLLDARRRRIRLPAEALAEAGVDLDQLLELRPQPALQACLRRLAERAASDLQAARQASIPRRGGPLLAARLVPRTLSGCGAPDQFDPRVIATTPDLWRLLGTATQRTDITMQSTQIITVINGASRARREIASRSSANRWKAPERSGPA
jgi:phytoene/squalene synthetase